MALMYAWAEKNYLLWKLSLDQIVLYHNKGMDIKYGNNGLSSKKLKELREIKERMKQEEELKKSEAQKEIYRQKYGEI